MALLGDPPLAVGARAPDFTLPDQAGNPVHLADLLKKGPVVLFFYPRDETAVCTAEACEFRDRHRRFVDLGASVLGISGDSVESHLSFQRNHALPYPLLSDGDGSVRASYGVKKVLGLLPARVTFVIDTSGAIRSVYTSPVRAARHVEEALLALEQIQRERSPTA